MTYSYRARSNKKHFSRVCSRRRRFASRVVYFLHPLTSVPALAEFPHCAAPLLTSAMIMDQHSPHWTVLDGERQAEGDEEERLMHGSELGSDEHEMEMGTAAAP